MRILQRVNQIVVAQFNEIVETFERPEPLLKQTIQEMETAVESATESTAKAIAAEKRLRQQLAECRGRAEIWRARAVESVRADDDEAARKALLRQREQERLATALAEQLARSEETGGRLRQQLDAMRGRLTEARRQLTSLVARQRSAEARRRFVKALGRFDTDAEAFQRFDELARRVGDAEAEADAMSELCCPEDVWIDADTDIELELQALKKECAGGTK